MNRHSSHGGGDPVMLLIIRTSAVTQIAATFAFAVAGASAAARIVVVIGVVNVSCNGLAKRFGDGHDFH